MERVICISLQMKCYVPQYADGRARLDYIDIKYVSLGLVFTIAQAVDICKKFMNYDLE